MFALPLVLKTSSISPANVTNILQVAFIVSIPASSNSINLFTHVLPLLLARSSSESELVASDSSTVYFLVFLYRFFFPIFSLLFISLSSTLSENTSSEPLLLLLLLLCTLFLTSYLTLPVCFSSFLSNPFLVCLLASTASTNPTN